MDPTFITGLPKVDLHCHIADSVPARMLFDIAETNGFDLSPFTPETIYQSKGFDDYLQRLALVCSALRKQENFRDILFEALKRMAACNTRYCELFFNPDDHPVAYPAMLEAYVDAIEAAETRFGIRARLIPSVNRALGPHRGKAMVEDVIRYRHACVVGVGLDNDELLGPPAHYVDVLALARAHGLHVSAHAGERFDADELRDAVDLLDIERIDHGYAVVRDAGLVARLRQAGTPFTACWTACARVNGSASAIVEMVRAGLNVTINTDAPASFATDLNREYELVAEAMGLGHEDISAIAQAGIVASHLSQGERQVLLDELAAYSASFR